MIYKFIKKFRKVICLLVVFCITIPLISACGEKENHLEESIANQVIGVGGSIEAYTTYSQAKFMEMDKNMYHSYLLSGRDFILVALPGGEADANGKVYPDKENLMFQAVYNGVTPYAEEIFEGNFLFKNPEYKILIYYVLASDFLDWDIEANNQADEGMLDKALDFLGPADADNYEEYKASRDMYISTELGMQPNVIKNEGEYNLKNVVNTNKYVSECDFLRVNKIAGKYFPASYDGAQDTNAIAKCGSDGNNIPRGQNVIAKVANGQDGINGVTLLFGSGGLTGYFTNKHVEEYDFNNAGWITELLNSKDYGGKMEKYVKHMLDNYICNGSTDGICSPSELSKQAAQMTFKFKYDLALLGRIRKIHYNTLLDINKYKTQKSVNTNYNGNLNEYAKILQGSTDYHSGDYIAFTTAEGFVLDRGNIAMQAGEDFLFNTNFLELLTQMDACTNRTLASYMAEVLADVGIIVGGIAVAVGAAILAYAAVASVASTVVSIATIGLASLSVPGAGWIIGGALLLVAGAVALFAGVTTKKAINDTTSANYCEVFKDAMDQIMDASYLKVPVYHYNIPADANYTTDICYGNYVYNPDSNREECGFIRNGVFEKSELAIPSFKMADTHQVDTLKELSGAPSVRLYSKGKVVDEIYGASSPQYLYAIMDSWGVTSATSMKYFVGVNMDEEGNPKNISIYDLLHNNDSVANAVRVASIQRASYCVSEKYGESCDEIGDKVEITNLRGNQSFANTGVYNLGITQSVTQKVDNLTTNITNDLKNEHQITSVEEYKTRLRNATSNAFDVLVESPADGGGNFVTIGGVRYSIGEDVDGLYFRTESTIIRAIGSEIVIGGNKFLIEKVPGPYYKVTYLFDENIDPILDDLRNLFGPTASEGKITNLKTALKSEFDKNSKADFDNIINDLDSHLAGIVYYNKKIPIYFTVSIVEKNSDDQEEETVTSGLYKNVDIKLVYGEE